MKRKRTPSRKRIPITASEETPTQNYGDQMSLDDEDLGRLETVANCQCIVNYLQFLIQIAHSVIHCDVILQNSRMSCFSLFPYNLEMVLHLLLVPWVGYALNCCCYIRIRLCDNGMNYIYIICYILYINNTRNSVWHGCEREKNKERKVGKNAPLSHVHIL